MPPRARRPSRRCLALLGVAGPALLLWQTAIADEASLAAPPLEQPASLGTEVKVPSLGDVEGAPVNSSVAPYRIEAWLDGALFPLRPGIGDPSPGRVEPVDIETEGSQASSGPATALTPPDPIAPPPVATLELMLDWYPSPQHAALYVARERGEFSRRGVDVVITTPADPDVPTKLLAAEHIDLALTRQPLLHREVDDGMPLVRVATLVGSPLAALVVREGRGVDSPADLAGLRLGHAGADSREVLLETLLRPHGIRSDEIELLDLDFGLVQAMVGGEVDAVIGGTRHLLPRQLADEGAAARALMVEDHGVPPHDGLIMVANRDRLSTHREAITEVVAALEAATDWMLDHPMAAWDLLLEAEPALDTPANQAAWSDILARLSARPAAVDQGRYARFEAFLHEARLAREITPVERLAIDPGAP
jgi:putative hydroxymethylpyrimidine transport system substrate-binding protein